MVFLWRTECTIVSFSKIFVLLILNVLLINNKVGNLFAWTPIPSCVIPFYLHRRTEHSSIRIIYALYVWVIRSKSFTLKYIGSVSIVVSDWGAAFSWSCRFTSLTQEIVPREIRWSNIIMFNCICEVLFQLHFFSCWHLQYRLR